MVPDKPDPPIARPARSTRAIVIAIMAGIVTCGLGYYSWTLRADRIDAEEELVEKRDSITDCTPKLTENGIAIGRLEQEGEDCKAGREQDKVEHAAIEETRTKLEKRLKASSEELDNLRKQRAEAEKRLAAFKELTTKLKAMIDVGTIDVKVRKGHLMVELPEAVMFAPGRAELSVEGKKALMEVGVALKKLPDRRFMVTGHTDNAEPVKSGGYHNNWELSTARAVVVTEFLVGVGMNPANLIAAGNGAHDPVADNKTKAGRRKNRRIEIALLPNLEELPIPEDTKPKPPEKATGGEKATDPEAEPE